MQEPFFLSIKEVLRFQQDLLAEFGGQEGVRNMTLLKPAIAQPRQIFAGVFLHEALAALTAANLFHIVSNQPFLDGNKRAGIHTTLAFLELNGFALNIDTDATGKGGHLLFSRIACDPCLTAQSEGTLF